MALTADHDLQCCGVQAAISSAHVEVVGRWSHCTVPLNQSLTAGGRRGGGGEGRGEESGGGEARAREEEKREEKGEEEGEKDGEEDGEGIREMQEE